MDDGRLLDFMPGGIANRMGDLWGTSPQRIIQHGRVVIDRVRVGAALMLGWRITPKSGDSCDPDFEWLERTQAERGAQRGR